MEGVCMDLYGDCMHEAPPPYKHIERNDFVYRKHVKQKDEDIVVCVCKFDEDDPDSACGDRCLNVLTSTECTPGYCPCGTYCNNQKFQKCQYAAVKLFKTEGRGWGLLASENIRVGQFVIEYCGEVISWNEAKRRSQEYEAAGLKDAFIICLHANEAIDATSKGSLARFINHSCQPNCETRKWTVLGEVRVGIFAKQDIPAGRELSYDYNFEWYGGSVVRCLCGASCCSGFLGAKSRGFQEATYLWEDDDDRYSVEKVPLYDSEEDDAASSKAIDSSKMALVAMAHAEYSSKLDGLDSYGLLPDAISAEPLNYIPVGDTSLNGHTIESMSNKSSSKQVGERNLAHKNTRLSPTGSRSAWRNDPVATRTLSKRFPNRKSKRLTNNDIDVKQIAEQLAWKEAREQLLAVEETKNLAASQLESLYDEIRPSIEEHERDSQDSVPTGVAEKWIKASCLNFKADFDLYSTIIRTIAFTPRKGRGSHVSTPAAEGLSSSAKLEDENEIKYLEMG